MYERQKKKGKGVCMGIRNIIFRGKRVDNGEWCYGVPLVEGWSKTTYIASYEYSSLAFVQQIEVDTETLGQFTGLTDKNGKRIFEGDIVRVKGKETEENWQDYDENGEVIFENGAFLIKVANIFNGKKYFSEVHCRYMTTADWVEREVIGNVFENKELLGENK